MKKLPIPLYPHYRIGAPMHSEAEMKLFDLVFKFKSAHPNPKSLAPVLKTLNISNCSAVTAMMKRDR